MIRLNQWCRYYRYQRSVSLSWSSFRWGRRGLEKETPGVITSPIRRTPVSFCSQHVMYWIPFMDLKTPLEALKVLFEGESEFDMLLFLPTAAALPTRRKRKLRINRSLFISKHIIGSDVSYPVFTIKARAQCMPACAQCYCQLSGWPSRRES